MDTFRRTVFADFFEDPHVPPRDVVVRAVALSFGGLDAVTSVVKARSGFYITFVSSEDADSCIESGLEVNGKQVEVHNVLKRTIIVNFLDIPEFVTDDTIVEKLTSLNCSVKGTIVWRKDQGLYDGTRTVRVELPESVSSLPYAIRLKDALGREAVYRVRHDSQAKVCNACLSSDHLYKDCPQFTCRKCQAQGHTAKNCPSWNTPKEPEPTTAHLDIEPIAEDDTSRSPSDLSFPQISPPAISPTSDSFALPKGTKHALSTSESDQSPKTRIRTKAKPNIPVTNHRHPAPTPPASTAKQLDGSVILTALPPNGSPTNHSQY